MSLRLYFSNNIEYLADKMSKNLDLEYKGRTNPFVGPNIIVPNMNLSKWLKLHLSFRDGIFMNAGFDYLESGLWNMLKGLDKNPTPARIADLELNKLFVFSILKNKLITQKQLGPIAHYLFGDALKAGNTFDIMAWQLSEQMARLFQEYEYHRADMIKNWGKTPVIKDGLQQCQCAIYLKMKELKEKMGRLDGVRLFSLYDYASQLFNFDQDLKSPEAHTINIHFFGMSLVSDFHLWLLDKFKKYYNIHIYAFNPSREFWEDIRTPGENRWIKKKNQKQFKIDPQEIELGDLFDKEDDMLLSVLGKPGRESIRLMCRLSDYDFETCFPEPVLPDTVLKAIQQNILTLGANMADTDRLNQDRSLQIIACPSRKREVETLLNSILFNMESDPNLQLTDIAILVPEMHTYRPFIDTVFNKGPGCISYNIVDSNAKTESVYGKAVLSLMALSQGLFSRKKIFNLMLNPCFMEKWKINHEQVEIWVNWAEKLNIYHGFNQHDKEGSSGQTTAPHTWKQGIDRLLLSRIMTVSTKDAADKDLHFQGLVPFGDIHTQDEQLLEGFCTAIQMLHTASKRIKVPSASAGQWKRKLTFLCRQLFDVPEHLKKENKIRQSILSALDLLSRYDEITENPAMLGPDMVKAFLLNHLASISGGAGDYLTGGVTISALMPMRPIPFKIIYVLGMEEGGFPGKARLSALDLRLKKRRIGDVTLPEKNRYLFLELLLSVKEKLYISYVAQDLQKDRKVLYSSVVNQLKRYTEQKALKKNQVFDIAKVPLKGSDINYYKLKQNKLWSDIDHNYFIMDKVTAFRKNGFWQGFLEHGHPEDILKAKELQPDVWPIKAGVKESKIDAVTVNIRQLVKFLLDPVRSKLQFGNKIYDDADSIEMLSNIEDEPLSTDFPADYILKTGTLKDWIDTSVFTHQATDDKKTLEHCFDAGYEQLDRKGYASQGEYSAFDRNKLKIQCVKTAEYAAKTVDQMRCAKTVYSNVMAGETTGDRDILNNSSDALSFKELSLEIKLLDETSCPVSLTIALNGQLPRVWEDHDNCVNCLVITGVKKRMKQPDKYVLGPVLFYLMLLSMDDSCKWLDKRSFVIHLVYENAVKTHRYLFNPITAKDFLVNLVSDFLDQTHTLWLPFQVAVTRSVKPHLQVETNLIDELAYAEEMALALSESEDLICKIAKATIDSSVFEKARTRFGLFFNEIPALKKRFIKTA